MQLTVRAGKNLGIFEEVYTALMFLDLKVLGFSVGLQRSRAHEEQLMHHSRVISFSINYSKRHKSLFKYQILKVHKN